MRFAMSRRAMLLFLVISHGCKTADHSRAVEIIKCAPFSNSNPDSILKQIKAIHPLLKQAIDEDQAFKILTTA